MRLRIGGCRVTVSFWFFALLAICGATSGDVMLFGILAAALHEAGHIAAAYICAGRLPASLEVTPFGLRMGAVPAGLSIRRELCVCASGIAANLTAATAAFLLRGSYSRFAAANICVAAVNAVAAEPLDGGSIARLLLGRTLSPERVERCMLTISAVSVFLLTLAGMLVLFESKRNFSLLALALWLAAKLLRELY